jgi:hypothetical protein
MTEIKELRTLSRGQRQAIDGPGSVRRNVIPRINSDELGIVSEFAGPSLNFASPSFRARHQPYTITNDNVHILLEKISRSGLTLHGSTFEIPLFTAEIQRHIPDLYRYAHELSIYSTGMPVTHPNDPTHDANAALVRALLGVKNARFLHTLHLGFAYKSPTKFDPGGNYEGVYDRINNEGLLALVALTDAPGLETLWLVLEDNDIDGRGMEALATLKDIPALRSLHMDLNSNRLLNVNNWHQGFCNPGAEFERLEPLFHKLCMLDLGLADTAISCKDVDVLLKMLSVAPKLHTLRLDLSWNWVTTIAELENARVHTLNLDLHFNGWILTADGPHLMVPGGMPDYIVRQLAGLRLNNRRLHTLRLGLHGNRIGPAGAATLATLNGLRSLHLDLSDNQIGDAGCTNLAGLSRASKLVDLTLILRKNQIGKAGAQELVQLKYSSTLRNLYIDLRSNNALDPVDCKAELAALQGLPALNFNYKCDGTRVPRIGSQADMASEYLRSLLHG